MLYHPSTVKRTKRHRKVIEIDFYLSRENGGPQNIRCTLPENFPNLLAICMSTLSVAFLPIGGARRKTKRHFTCNVILIQQYRHLVLYCNWTVYSYFHTLFTIKRQLIQGGYRRRACHMMVNVGFVRVVWFI